MTNFIPIFPLGIVVFPGEELNLHIFEPRYKQLINDCFSQKKPFGLPTLFDQGLSERGTLVKINEIVKVYDDGKMDIKTQGVTIFRILEVVKSIPEKLYSGAIVNYPDNDINTRLTLLKKVLTAIKEMHAILKVNKQFSKSDEHLLSYDLAHHAGLSLEEEYELTGLLQEDQRLEYLIRHLKKSIPVVKRMEELKERIKLNGHFKELDGESF